MLTSRVKAVQHAKDNALPEPPSHKDAESSDEIALTLGSGRRVRLPEDFF